LNAINTFFNKGAASMTCVTYEANTWVVMNNSLGENFVHWYKKANVASNVTSSQTETAGYLAFSQ